MYETSDEENNFWMRLKSAESGKAGTERKIKVKCLEGCDGLVAMWPSVSDSQFAHRRAMIGIDKIAIMSED